MDEYTREPCPIRIVDDCGGAFAMGLTGGSIFHAIKGARSSAPGYRSRIAGMAKTAAKNAPVTGGQFAMWGFTFSLTDCILSRLRKKEDSWNSIMSGGITGAVLTARLGVPTMAGSAFVGAVLLGLIEGVGIVINRFSAEQFKPQNPGFEEPAALPQKEPSASTVPSSNSNFPFGGPQMNLGGM